MTTARTPAVSVLVHLGDGLEWTAAALEALEAVPPPVPFEVLLVDDATRDGTSAWLTRLEGAVTVLRHDQPQGFGQSINAAAAKSAGDLLLILHHDCMLTPGVWDPLLGALADTAVGACAPVVLDPNGEAEPGLPAVLPAACILIRRGVFEAAGGLDSAYPGGTAQMTDLALCLQRAGHSVTHARDATVVHAGAHLPDAGRVRFAARWPGVALPPDHRSPAAVHPPRPSALPDRPAFANGHFYSPVVDVAEAARDRARIWSRADLAGIDFNPEGQAAFLAGPLRRYAPDFDYPDQLPAGSQERSYYTGNSQFGWLDARVLYVGLRHWRPRRMLEVGSGYSSLLVADVNRRFLDGALDFRCIEPYPRPFLREGVEGISEVIVARVQDVDPAVFDALEPGDILFIDSSHVSKTGSDVNHLLLSVLPRLQPGVLVHIHDVFLPDEYPADWVLEDGRSWNEQYLVHALLLYSDGFEIVVGSAYAHRAFPDLVSAALGGPSMYGGSLWLRKRR